MEGIVVKLHRRDKRRLVKRLRKLKDAGMRTRYCIIVNLAEYDHLLRGKEVVA